MVNYVGLRGGDAVVHAGTVGRGDESGSHGNTGGGGGGESNTMTVSTVAAEGESTAIAAVASDEAG
ncbi:hypothetical protein IscW_ISCW001143 [Ixodes scapularis]|uniref:Uncharacterized protein n=1 Tax=Ixodes scapularis TaxID=6945 RepID=B7P4L8_IXOSC|nr:hypothetical protein IscW_ISCW001143 [Ixodes scapularis]|eukprot:XP_002406218.1 hypothetical protein IscW_ISCW001143 [Ixodes scapularis]